MMRARFWGVRGSYPVAAASVARYGGHTSCVELAIDDDQSPCVLDAGTGLPQLGRALLAGPCGKGAGTIRLFLSHLHWDHVQGLPLFAPAYVPGNRIIVYGRGRAGASLRDAVLGSMRPELFPLRFDKSAVSLEFVEVTPGVPFDTGGARVTPLALNHPFGAIGYRFDAGGRSLAYITDTSPFSDILYPEHFVSGAPASLSEADRAELARLRAALVAGLRGADTTIYDTQYTDGEYARFPHFGHGTAGHALDVLADAGGRRLVLYHHAPGRTDEGLDAQLADARRLAPAGITVDAAIQGQEIVA
jgi:phosphoribosyl 1,2-cyclic phosphodiesterase